MNSALWHLKSANNGSTQTFTRSQRSVSNKILCIIFVTPQTILPIWFLSMQVPLFKMATSTIFSYWNAVSNIFTWNAASVKMRWSNAIALPYASVLFCLVIQLYVDPCLLPSTLTFLKPINASYFAFTLKYLPSVVNGQYTSAKFKWFQKVGHGIEKYLSPWTYGEESRGQM